MYPSTGAFPWAHPGVTNCIGISVRFREPGLKRYEFGGKGAMSTLTLNDCPSCGLVETTSGGHPRCPECGHRLGCEEPPERGDYDYDEAP